MAKLTAGSGMIARVVDFSRVLTARLTLTRPVDADLDEMHALLADPGVWQHFPSLRHTDRARTEEFLRRQQRSWDEHGLGTWIARRPVSDGPGELVGIGGSDARDDVAWNLGYRLVRPAWGHGYAQEILAAARAAALQIRPERPVTASLLEHNAGSKRTAERAGLHLVWRGLDGTHPDPNAVRLVYADRAVDNATLRVLVAHR